MTAIMPAPTADSYEDGNIDVQSFKKYLLHHLHCTVGKDESVATRLDFYNSLVYVVRDHMLQEFLRTRWRNFNSNRKRVYYLSMEFLIGQSLDTCMINLGIENICKQGLSELGLKMEEMLETEPDAGLGNGGLGRLAACFLDSMATLGLAAYGYGLRYDYGIFTQRIEDGYQVETPDHWLRYGNPWEIARAEDLYEVRFYGRVNQYYDATGRLHNDWVDYDPVMAMAYDMPVPGYRNGVVNNLRLWCAKSTRGFNLQYFNHGNYIRAVEDNNHIENITRVLYPNDSFYQGQELRLKQEYFLVSATLQDAIRRYKLNNGNFDAFPDKVAIQMNDTHPALCVAELMRLFIDVEKLHWDKAWDLTTRTMAYTNHTILPEALERWRLSLFGNLLPRHLQIIYEINQRFLDQLNAKYPGDHDKQRRLSIIEEGPEKQVRMAHLAVVGSHKVNGVSALHSDLLKRWVFKEFHEFYPGKFTNKTNGITPRRWLLKANPLLADLITRTIGSDWVTDLDQLKRLAPYAEDASFRKEWIAIKRENKIRLAHYIREKQHIELNVDSMFDCQVKRLHEYKRQLLNVLHAITLFNRIVDNPSAPFVPRTILLGGKAAPAYHMAKLIIKLTNAVAKVVNNDYRVQNRLKIAFLENYRVSLAEKIMPAADLSEQISTAGTEASGTGNMKFTLNGALTIGTLDGANVEIHEAVGDENIFIFGLTTEEVAEQRAKGYNPWEHYNRDPELKRALDMIADGEFSPENHALFQPLVHSLLGGGDFYYLLADYRSFVNCQQRVSDLYKNETAWTKMSIINVANVGRFSSDRTIRDYAKEIWNVDC